MPTNNHQNIINSKENKSRLDSLVEDKNEVISNDYQAFVLCRTGSPQAMLAINYQQDKELLFYYFDIRTILFEGDTLISIIRPHEIITIEGRNFASIKKQFKENKIQTIHEYNSSIFSPPESNKPFIEKITISSQIKQDI